MPALSTNTRLEPDSLDEPAIPYDWTADQALAVVEFLETLDELVWSRYGRAIAKKYYPHQAPLPETPQLMLPFPPLWEQRIHMDDIDSADNDVPF